MYLCCLLPLRDIIILFDYFFMVQCSLFVLKVPLKPKQASKQTIVKITAKPRVNSVAPVAHVGAWTLYMLQTVSCIAARLLLLLLMPLLVLLVFV